jgi:tetratricopeptide (TPR) repeat protein
MRFSVLVLIIAVLSQRTYSWADAQEQRLRAQQTARAGEMAQAELLYREILRARPHWIPAELDLAILYQFEHRFPEAIGLLNDVLRQDPSLAIAIWFRGSDAYQSGNYRLAVSAMQQFLRLQPHNAEARFYLGASYYQLAQYPKAARILAQQVDLYPQTEGAYLQLIQSYEALRQSALDQINRDRHARYFALLLESESNQNEGRSGNAARAAHLAATIDADAPEAWLVLAKQSEAEGHWQESRDFMTRADHADAKDHTSLRGIVDAEVDRNECDHSPGKLVAAACHAAHGDFALATNLVLASSTPDTASGRRIYWQAEIYSRLIEQSGARLATLFPRSPDLRKLYARAYEREGKRAQAAHEYEEAILEDDQDASSFVEYATFCSRGQEFVQAIELLRKALALTPDDYRVKQFLGEEYLLNSEPAKGVAYLRDALSAQPNNSPLRLQLAQGLHTLGQLPEAVGILEGATSDPGGRISYTLGTYYALQGKMEQAKRAKQRFQRLQGAASP